MSFQLSMDQTKAINGIHNVLFDPKLTGPALAVLTGSAGTGKTTVVTEIIEVIRKYSTMTNVELCATTHRAAKVLENITGQDVSTAHALFKLRPTVNKYGKEELKSAGKCEIPHGSTVIIDEASMFGNQFLKAIVKIVQKLHLKILFVGDPFQLPPPKDICTIFDGSLPTFTLTTVHRQNTGNPILDKAIEYRDFIAGKLSDEPTLTTDINSTGEGIHILPHSDFITSFVQKYMSYTTGSVIDIPLCTYTNDSAINYNNMIRKAAYFLEGTVQPFYAGERLVSNSLVRQGDRTLLTNNEEVTVISYKNYEHKTIPGYLVRVSGEFNPRQRSALSDVFVPINKSAADKVLNELKKIAIKNRSKSDWVDFYELKSYLADLRPPFAGTTHKAQGGTFPAVFIDKVNIQKCRDPAVRARLFYVALTRASKNAYINS